MLLAPGASGTGTVNKSVPASFEILSFHYLTTSKQLVGKQGAKLRETGREQNSQDSALHGMFCLTLPRGPCALLFPLAGKVMVLSSANQKPQDPGGEGAEQGLRVWVVAARPAPAHLAPGKEPRLFAPVQFISLLAAPAVMDQIPTLFLAHSPLLKMPFSRASGAPGRFPGVLVEVCLMKKAHFSDF